MASLLFILFRLALLKDALVVSQATPSSKELAEGNAEWMSSVEIAGSSWKREVVNLEGRTILRAYLSTSVSYEHKV
jgi:hypothetical protein